MPVPKLERHIGATERFARGNNVEHSWFLHTVGMVKCQAVGTASTAIVSRHRKALETKMTHEGDLVLCRDAL